MAKILEILKIFDRRNFYFPFEPVSYMNGCQNCIGHSDTVDIDT